MSTTPHSNDPRDNAGEFVLGKDGKPLVDRYGRPIRRRTNASHASRRDPVPRHPDEFTRVEPRARRVSPRVEPGHTVYEPPAAYEPRRAPEHPRSRPVQQPAQQPAQQRPVQHQSQYAAPRPASRPSAQPAPEDVPLQVSRGRRRGPKVRRKVKLPGCGAVLALVIALLIGSVLIADARLNRTSAMPEQQISGTSGTNWLLVGSDSRTGLSEKDVERLGTGGDLGTVRTDTIMLMHLPLRGKPTLVSIPRDSYVPVPGYGYDKINAAFSIGGPQLLVETVEHNTGLHVDRYAEIGMGGLAGVVDAAGGVEICVAEPIDDPLANINLQPGCQQMDGPTALGYVRTRATAQGDLDRVARQREFMTTLVTRVLSPSVYLNPFRMARLLWVTPSLLTVNSDDHAWNLARIVIALRGGLETETVPIGGFTDTEVGNVVLWDDTEAAALFDSLR